MRYVLKQVGKVGVWLSVIHNDADDHTFCTEVHTRHADAACYLAIHGCGPDMLLRIPSCYYDTSPHARIFNHNKLQCPACLVTTVEVLSNVPFSSSNSHTKRPNSTIPF
jgi:hypothetical protein